MMNGVCQKSDNRFSSPALDLKLITPTDLSNSTNLVKMKQCEKYLPVTVIEVLLKIPGTLLNLYSPSLFFYTDFRIGLLFSQNKSALPLTMVDPNQK